MKMIIPAKNHIDTSILVYPETLISPSMNLYIVYIANKNEMIDIKTPAFIIKLSGLFEKDKIISNPNLNRFLKL